MQNTCQQMRICWHNADFFRWVLKIRFVRFWIYFRGKIGSRRGSVASYVTDCTYYLARKETKR